MRKQSPSRITEDQFKQIKELKEQGLFTLTVAQLVGVSSVTVRRIFNTKRGYVPPLNEQFVDKYDRNAVNTLIPVEDLDFANGEYFCIDKWAAAHQLGPYIQTYKSKIA